MEQDGKFLEDIKKYKITELKEIKEDIGIDIPKWIEEHENLTYSEFAGVYYLTFGIISYSIHDWKESNTHLSFIEYIDLCNKKNEEYENRRNRMHFFEDLIGEMWNNGEIIKFISNKEMWNNDINFISNKEVKNDVENNDTKKIYTRNSKLRNNYDSEYHDSLEEKYINDITVKQMIDNYGLCVNTNGISREQYDNDIKAINEWRESGTNLSYYDYHTNKTKTDYTKFYNEIEYMENKLNNYEGFDEEQIVKIKERIKEIELKLKEKIKPKTITVSNSIHNRLKKHCLDFNLKIGDWVEKTLNEKMDEMSPIIIGPNPTRKEEENFLLEKYKKDYKLLVKSDKLLLPNLFFNGSIPFKFVGYHALELKPVYEYIGNNYDRDIQNSNSNIEKLPIGIIPTCKKYLPQFADFDIDYLTTIN